MHGDDHGEEEEEESEGHGGDLDHEEDHNVPHEEEDEPKSDAKSQAGQPQDTPNEDEEAILRPKRLKSKLPEENESVKSQIIEDKDKSFHSAQSSNSLVEESEPLIEK